MTTKLLPRALAEPLSPATGGSPLSQRCRVLLLDRFSPREALRLVAQERVTVLPGMPARLM